MVLAWLNLFCSFLFFLQISEGVQNPVYWQMVWSHPSPHICFMLTHCKLVWEKLIIRKHTFTSTQSHLCSVWAYPEIQQACSQNGSYLHICHLSMLTRFEPVVLCGLVKFLNMPGFISECVNICPFTIYIYFQMVSSRTGQLAVAIVLILKLW